MEKWSTKKSLALYSVREWSLDFFNINSDGNVVVSPKGKGGPKLDLFRLVGDLRARGMRLPLWIRFPDIVRSRINRLSASFQNAFETFEYSGKYKGVYPIKVNQQRSLVQDIVRFGADTDLGLEAGSKPELLIALAEMRNADGLIVCNGFKDRDYIQTALLARKLGRQVIIVVDRFEELKVLIDEAKRLEIRPQIGFRMKLEERGAGKWVESSGARSKFGLTATEVVQGIEMLKGNEMLDSLVMLHFHLGSQISSIRPIKESLREACHVYTEICKLGASLKLLDVGGGLGIDYDGSKTNSENSMNYSEQEYANDVVEAICGACEENDLPHPDIVTEAGRALVAHHSVLVFNVLGENAIVRHDIPSPPPEDVHSLVLDMYALYENTNSKNLVETYHDVLQVKEESLNLFKMGYLCLTDRAAIESFLWYTLSKIRKILREIDKEIPEELEGIEKMLRDAYYCNFSIFQSAPDHWAVKQLFPVMPLHRLDEEPGKRVTLMDLTCDSDGIMDRFIDIKDVKNSLEVHPLKPGEEYLLGMFLLGAYQETLGDLHNLFGDTDAVHVSITDDEKYQVDHFVEGDSVKQVLSYLQYHKHALVERMRIDIEQSLSDDRMTFQEGRDLLEKYEAGLSGYTYLTT